MAGIKEGYKTTEFWMAISANILGILVIFGMLTPVDSSGLIVMLEKIIGALMISLPSFGYTLSRGKTKAAASIAEKIMGV